MIGQIPIPKFLEKKHQGILVKRLYHKCMDIITENLKAASFSAVEMVDAQGILRAVRTFLIAHLADFPEQQLISGVSQNYSPTSFAELHQFGDARPHRLRTGTSTLRQIKTIRKSVPTNDLSEFLEASTKFGLNGIHQPFWRDWEFADPCYFLTPDPLHQWHRMFIDHPMKWLRKLMGDLEVDRRISSLQKWIGKRHFVNGFTRYKQHTGREQRDLQSFFIGIMNGHRTLKPEIIKAFRGLLDFIYIGQYESHSTTTLKYLNKALNTFHANKYDLSRAGARNGKRRNWFGRGEFFIPKLERLQHAVRLIKLCGSAPQFSTEFVERCHITMAKHPYRASNHEDYPEQMCRSRDREEKIVLFDQYLDWYSLNHRSRSRSSTTAKTSTVGAVDSRKAIFLEFSKKQLPQPTVSFFDKKGVSQNDTTAFILTKRITRKGLSLPDASELYDLPRLRYDLYKPPTPPLPFDQIDVWDRVRLQLRATQSEKALLSPETVLALPPSKEMPLGHCNFVLVKNPPESSHAGIRGMYLPSPCVLRCEVYQ